LSGRWPEAERKVIIIQNIVNNISIALCTYNGENFLPEQLESIAAQTMAPAELVVCDDGSADGTLALLENFSGRVGFPVRIYRNERRLGAIQNYARAVTLCCGRYVALCDQDDIWHPGKLALSMQAMRDAESIYGEHMPILLHTDLQVVDESGAEIAPSLMKMQQLKHVAEEPLKTLLVQNFVTGCTVLMNRPLIGAALPLPENILMHDWWFALMAASLGKLVYISQATVRYRQHGGNEVGAKKYFSGANILRLARIEQMERMVARTVGQLCSLRERLSCLSGAQIPAYMSAYLDAALESGSRAACYARRHGIGKQGRLRNLVFLSILLTSRYLAYMEGYRAADRNHS